VKNYVLLFIFLSTTLVVDQLATPLRKPASLFSFQKLNLDREEEKLRDLLTKVFTEEVSYSQLDDPSRELVHKAFESYFDPAFRDRDRLVTIFLETTNLFEKLDSMTFMERRAVRSIQESITMIKDFGPLIWSSMGSTEQMAEVASASLRDSAALASGRVSMEGASVASRQLLEGLADIGTVALRRTARHYVTSYFDELFSNPGMAIPADNANIEIFIDFIHTIEMYKIAKSVDQLSDFADAFFMKLVAELPLVSRQLEGLAKTPGGLFLHIELKSALSLFLQEVDDPQTLLNDLEKALPENIDDVLKREITLTISSLKSGVQKSNRLLRNNASEGLMRKGLRYGFSGIISTGDELSLGLHLFRHYGNELLTRENDNFALRGSRLLLNTLVNSTSYTGRGAGFLFEQTYQYIGMADPDFNSAINAIRSVGTTVSDGANLVRSGVGSITSSCTSGLQRIWGRKKSD
jgi:hypothetical protein